MSLTDTNKLRARVATLDKLLDDFDGELDDLLAKSLPETLLGLDTLQQAKLQVTIPYLVYDLVIIYLKTKGIDPKTHPVFRELERVKGYIEKVSKAEKQESEQQRMAIDKAAANRFIKHAIIQATRAQGQSSTAPADQEPTPGPSKIPAQLAPVGATNKMLARAEWDKQLKEAAEEEEEDLEVFEETEGYADADADAEMIDDKVSALTSLPVGTGETTLSEQQPVTTKKKKKSKSAKLPLTGTAFTTTTIDVNAGTEGAEFSVNSPSMQQPEIRVTTAADPTSMKVTGKKRPFPPSETPTGDSEDPSASTSTSAPKNKKRKRNKKQNAQMAIAGGGDTDGATTSQSQSQSREVSVASTPQAQTQPLTGVETDTATTGGGENPRKWRKYIRKKKNAGSQPAAGTGTRP